jgi:hypothetical protein
VKTLYDHGRVFDGGDHLQVPAMRYAASSDMHLNGHHWTLAVNCPFACLRYNDEVPDDKCDRTKHAMRVPADNMRDMTIKKLSANPACPPTCRTWASRKISSRR